MERVPCENAGTDACPVYQQEGECFEDVHHLYWPANKYKGKWAKTFRQLDDNKVRMCRMLHNIEHAVVDAPPMPSLDVMKEAINQERQSRKEP